MQQINPINTVQVIRDGGAHGQIPGDLHVGVGWWLAACLVVVERASTVVIGHDGAAVSAEIHDRACGGVRNAEHYACCALSLGHVTESRVLDAVSSLGAPGIHVSIDRYRGRMVSIRLYGRKGALLEESTGLARIRQLIAEDRVPRPVNSAAQGRLGRYSAPGRRLQ
ncbi:hypothetical protein ACPA54_09130 [Uniformispora flossi]|uniref:hypothetical protein n=1 Tax=Uniformispora flossi TaxID=3390723 RepID=UPI003C2C264D